MKRTLIHTTDGSHSLFIEELNEHYHSIHGAIQESKHVFIEAGFKMLEPLNEINILEIGFGTGLNAFLTLIENTTSDKNIRYTALEAFPLEEKIYEQLNYAKLLNESTGIFQLLHSCDWEKEIPISKNFTLHKIKNTLQQGLLPNQQFDLIYFDAFGPPVQPELWTEEIFQKIYNATKPNGTLVTYCAKGEVKRTLKKVGFSIESIPGPPGKREMVRAKKKLNSNFAP